uniref:Uncharacterized protein n=1 Tax=Arundo donax TaxID=35708 RepID=A0A0A9BEW6_ARUDO
MTILVNKTKRYRDIHFYYISHINCNISNKMTMSEATSGIIHKQ